MGRLQSQLWTYFTGLSVRRQNNQNNDIFAIRYRLEFVMETCEHIFFNFSALRGVNRLVRRGMMTVCLRY
jgi:hypothetical protein